MLPGSSQTYVMVMVMVIVVAAPGAVAAVPQSVL